MNLLLHAKVGKVNYTKRSNIILKLIGLLTVWCRHSSAGIGTGYGLEGTDSIPGSEKCSLLRGVQIDSGAQPNFLSNGFQSLSLGVKRPEREANHLPPSSDVVHSSMSLWYSAKLIKHRGNFTITDKLNKLTS
jgi:hypothetical protein